jgi:hypothetical protein
MALPFVSADSYDLKDACKHPCWLLKTERKFSHGTQSQAKVALTILGPSKNGFQWTSCLTLSAVRNFFQSSVANICDKPVQR